MTYNCHCTDGKDDSRFSTDWAKLKAEIIAHPMLFLLFSIRWLQHLTPVLWSTAYCYLRPYQCLSRINHQIFHFSVSNAMIHTWTAVSVSSVPVCLMNCENHSLCHNIWQIAVIMAVIDEHCRRNLRVTQTANSAWQCIWNEMSVQLANISSSLQDKTLIRFCINQCLHILAENFC